MRLVVGVAALTLACSLWHGALSQGAAAAA
jgi:hypothetical protein